VSAAASVRRPLTDGVSAPAQIHPNASLVKNPRGPISPKRQSNGLVLMTYYSACRAAWALPCPATARGTGRWRSGAAHRSPGGATGWGRLPGCVCVCVWHADNNGFGAFASHMAVNDRNCMW
jgi:hypothetical protein